jgi:hypothetical protein
MWHKQFVNQICVVNFGFLVNFGLPLVAMSELSLKRFWILRIQRHEYKEDYNIEMMLSVHV